MLEHDASFTLKITDGTYKGKTPIRLLKKISYTWSQKDKIDLKALNLEQLYRNKELHKAEIPQFIKSNISLLNKNMQKLFALNKFLKNNSTLVSNEEIKLLEDKIYEYVGYQNLAETQQQIFTLKHFVTLKIIQNPDEYSEHFPDILAFSTIEMIEKLEQEYGVNLSGIIKES